MGSRMATRLIQAGFEVAVWNETASACDELIALARHAASIGARLPIILWFYACLADDAAVACGLCKQIYNPFSGRTSHCRFFQSIGKSNQ